MALCVVATAWFPLLSISALPSENYNEGWNAYRQWMTVQGQPLYGARQALWTTNYPFLSFHLIGLLGRTRHGMVEAGRSVSFLSLILTALLMGGIIREATGSRPGAVYAGLCLFVWLACFYATGRADDDPEMLSLAFASFGLFSYFKARGRSFGIILSGVVFALSLFTKHDLIALPISVGAHLLIIRNWRGLAMFSAAGIAAAAALLALTFDLDGSTFFSQLLQPRAYVFSNLSKETLHYLVHFIVPLVIGVTVLIGDREAPFRGFLFILLIFTHLIAIFFAGGDGVASNIFYPPFIADLLACVIAICRLQHYAVQMRCVQTSLRLLSFENALTAVTLVAAVMVLFQLHMDIVSELRMPAATKAAQQAIAILQATHGPAICEDMLLCYEAGKPMDYDPYYVKDQLLMGRIQEGAVLASLDAHHYAAIQIDFSMQKALAALPNYGRFSAPFLHSLLRQYRPVMLTRYDSVFVPYTNDHKE